MNTVVNMTYELKDPDGNLLESSNEPVTYLHGGYDNIFPKVEEAMHGKSVGETVVVSLEPASAFPEAELKEGMQFEGEDDTGEIIIYTVTNIADGKVVVDGNHPWAGQRVVFTAVIKDVRSANEEEIEHKHVHGAGGHHH